MRIGKMQNPWMEKKEEEEEKGEFFISTDWPR